MAFDVAIDIQREFSVDAEFDEVLALFADVPTSSQFFPQVDQLVDLGDGIYRWEFEKIKLGKYVLQTIYASQYEVDEEAGTVTWTQVAGEGNGLVSGGWELEPAEGGTNVTLTTSAVLTMDFPSLAKMMVSPLVKSQFSSMVDTYINNISAHFSS